GTLTDPNINKIINKKGGVDGVATKGADARTLEAGSAREKGLLEVLTNGAVGDAKKAKQGGTKADNKKLLEGKVDPATIQTAAPAPAPAPAVSAYAAPAAAAAPTTAIEQALAQLKASVDALLLKMGLSTSAASNAQIGSSALTPVSLAASPAPVAAPRPVAAPAPQVAPTAARPVATTAAS
ncbi:MAG: hypothetical protein JWM98_2076, partial [Thermoleophilia bacterium]|nr:hypothetical protein [Thermoleophilia bacterium]